MTVAMYKIKFQPYSTYIKNLKPIRSTVQKIWVEKLTYNERNMTPKNNVPYRDILMNSVYEINTSFEVIFFYKITIMSTYSMNGERG